ncbi:hypothetical protein GP486_001924 [Trichoglossum hirsutum]|uniref:Uncharacterized protein n=1 Tax=Trichoglossum hirsutum TaxID=265104 RepID=A0A9P8LFR1_9PEZI|nr:hypothetical protein GP486_001924 [Trichoglossum hirsutum]
MTPRAAADWVALHGNAVISDTLRPVDIAHSPREAVITPKIGTPDWSTGVVHFALPNAPNGSTKPSRLLVDFQTVMAIAKKVEIYFGPSEVFQLSLTDEYNLEDLDVSSISASVVQPGKCGHGISLSITLWFQQPSSKVSIESVGLIFR